MTITNPSHMKYLPTLLPFLLMLTVGCADAPPAGTDATATAVDTTAQRLEQARQDIEESGEELDRLINDL